jgi:ABC-2 type transport system permease protein
LAEPVGNVDSGAFWGSFIGLILLAFVYSAIGIFASSLSKNQVISFIIAVVVSFMLFYGFDILTSFFDSGNTMEIIEQMGIHAHYKSISRGVIDSRDLVYFSILSYVFLFFTQLKISKN